MFELKVKQIRFCCEGEYQVFSLLANTIVVFATTANKYCSTYSTHSANTSTSEQTQGGHHLSHPGTFPACPYGLHHRATLVVHPNVYAQWCNNTVDKQGTGIHICKCNACIQDAAPTRGGNKMLLRRIVCCGGPTGQLTHSQICCQVSCQILTQAKHATARPILVACVEHVQLSRVG